MEKNIKFNKKIRVFFFEFLYSLRGNQKWDKQTFYPMMMNFKEKFGYDFLSTKGLALII